MCGILDLHGNPQFQFTYVDKGSTVEALHLSDFTNIPEGFSTSVHTSLYNSGVTDPPTLDRSPIAPTRADGPYTPERKTAIDIVQAILFACAEAAQPKVYGEHGTRLTIQAGERTFSVFVPIQHTSPGSDFAKALDRIFWAIDSPKTYTCDGKDLRTGGSIPRDGSTVILTLGTV